MHDIKMNYYYGFRQIKPSPPGAWVLCGGNTDKNQVESERYNSMAWDCELSPIFSASSRSEAKAIIERMNA